ncbi:MAG: FG-GAP-like repeat-containing protein [Polyangiales bacterium]
MRPSSGLRLASAAALLASLSACDDATTSAAPDASERDVATDLVDASDAATLDASKRDGGVVDVSDVVDATADVALDVTRDAVIEASIDAAPDVLVCDAGATACGRTCVDVTSSLAHCGACDHACVAPDHGAATCERGACGFTCEAMYTRVGAGCVRIDPPRLLAPLTTAAVTSRRPRLRWSLAAGTDGAVIDLCADRMCATVTSTLEATGTSAMPPSELAPGRVYWRARGRVGSTTGSAVSPTWQFVVGARSAAVDTSWGAAFDPDGDGRTDLAVGVPNRASSTGRVLIYTAGATGYGAAPSLTLDGRDGMNAVFGSAAACAGDVNGDGFVDLAIGAYRASSGVGRVYGHHGGASGVALAPSTTLVGRDGADGDFGISVASAGDVNGDGYGDLVVGASVVSRFTGRAYVYLGGATGLATTPATSWTGPDGPNGFFGNAVASAGDVNGDGYGDVLVGAAMTDTATGKVYLYLGSATGLPTTASTVLAGPDGTLADFGVSIASAGDVNGDGYGDVLVGADRVGSFAGRVYVFHGGATGLSTTPATRFAGVSGTDTNLGASVVAAGDVNRDGYGDVALFSGNAATGGRVRVFLGSATGLSTTAATVIAAPDGAMSAFGAATQGAGDVNGDGFADLVISAANTAARPARVHLFAGSMSGLSTAPTMTLVSAEDATAGFGAPLVGATGR